ncbi:MAG: sensor histidine kinase [Actinobacteria bacterium]|nr:sensor histidine kinase [Actinomycetota bacterium]
MASLEVNQGLEPARWQRRMLPGSMVDGPGAERSLRDWAVDVLITIVALGIGMIALHDTWSEHGTTTAILDIGLGIASLAALWDRRRHPVGVAAFVIPAASVSGLAAGAGLAVLFNAAVRCSRRGLVWITVASVAGSLVYSLLYAVSGADFRNNFLVGILLYGFTIGWGLFVRVRRDLVDQLHERATRLEGEGRLRAERARSAERERIAREMHDVLAHRLSLLSLHAGALEFRPDAPPAEVAATAAVIREAAAAALEELRDVVGVLREGTDSETRRPQPGLAEVPMVIEESRAAGMRIEAELDLPDEAGATIVGRTAYRVVQEGLTNARKHAPGVLVRVKVTSSPETLRIEVRNPAPLVPPPAPALPGAGSGLVGLGERVALADGELRKDITPGGDFILEVILPWER